MDFGDEVGKVKQVVNLGFRAQHTFFGTVATTFALDYKDLAGELGNDKDKGKRIHAGAEIGFWKLLRIRAGVNQGYGTFGADLDLWILRFSYARYTEEVGAYAGQKKDERHVFQLTAGW
jgi:hypothetical protein